MQVISGVSTKWVLVLFLLFFTLWLKNARRRIFGKKKRWRKCLSPQEKLLIKHSLGAY